MPAVAITGVNRLLRVGILGGGSTGGAGNGGRQTNGRRMETSTEVMGRHPQATILMIAGPYLRNNSVRPSLA